MKVSIIKMQNFIKIKNDFKGSVYVIEMFCIRFIKTLTYVLLDNFCPCFCTFAMAKAIYSQLISVLPDGIKLSAYE